MFQIVLSSQARKSLKKLDKVYRPKVVKSIDALAFNPFLGEKMEGELKLYYRVKIPPLRIIYQPDFKNRIIYIRAIGFRGDIYKK
jgi:mRNA-degrading endonuclease RelE of RelBE toxin-antitoxin system